MHNLANLVSTGGRKAWLLLSGPTISGHGRGRIFVYKALFGLENLHACALRYLLAALMYGARGFVSNHIGTRFKASSCSYTAYVLNLCGRVMVNMVVRDLCGCHAWLSREITIMFRCDYLSNMREWLS
jgi:hypothetical protein